MESFKIVTLKKDKTFDVLKVPDLKRLIWSTV